VPRTHSTRLVAGRTALAGTLLAVGLTGCAYASPSTITTPYPASDGVDADIPGTGVGLRNFIVIGTEKGAPASVVGVIVNDSDTNVQVSLQADLGETAQPSQTLVQIPPHGTTQIGPAQATTMQIPDLPVVPGALTGLSAATPQGGRADLSVPVLLPVGAYASLTPAPTPSGTSSPGNEPSSPPTETPAGGATPTST
jgi:hypothetical protein